ALVTLLATSATTAAAAAAPAASALDSFPAQMDRFAPLLRAGRYAAADSLASVLMTALAAVGQADSSRAADVLDQWVLNRILWTRFNDDTVKAAALRSLAIRQRVYGVESAQAAVSLNVLGRLASYRGRSAESDSVYRRALAIQERVLGPDDPAV